MDVQVELAQAQGGHDSSVQCITVDQQYLYSADWHGNIKVQCCTTLCILICLLSCDITSICAPHCCIEAMASKQSSNAGTAPWKTSAGMHQGLRVNLHVVLLSPVPVRSMNVLHLMQPRHKQH